MCTASPWNFTGISHTGTCCPDISTSIHQVYTAYYWVSNIFITVLISRGWYSEVYSSHFISLLHDRTLMSTPFAAFILCTPCTHCMCWHCHIGFTYTKRIHLVYSSFTSLHKRYIVHATWYIYSQGIPLVYNMYTSGFILKAVCTTIIYLRFLKRKYFSYCPSRLRMLARGSTPPWRPGQQYPLKTAT